MRQPPDSMCVLRDKDYIETHDGLLFNVVGYEHPSDGWVANLKYVDGRKWKSGYAAAVQFLRERFPAYVQRYIQVPHERIRCAYRSAEGLRRLRELPARNPLQELTLRLVDRLAREFALPSDAFGLTDSLLWSAGGPQSDIDLVVQGTAAARQVLLRLPALYEQDEFTFDPSVYDLPADVPEAAVARIRERRLHLGVFRGVKFSLRAVRTVNTPEDPALYKVAGLVERRATIVDVASSLYFPAVYELDTGEQLDCYAAAYEAVFCVGEPVRIRGQLETGPGDRLVVGSVHLGEYVCWQDLYV